MEKRRLGSQGLVVSAQGLGCMGMSEFYGATDEREAIATIARAIELGVTFLDTADMYGPFANERLLGRAIASRRDEVVLATKVGFVRTEAGGWLGVSGRPGYVRSACESSLQRLGVDYIDVYYQHRVDPVTPVEETVGAMAELVHRGLVRYLGLSEATGELLRRACAVHPISVVQNEYSIWSREVEDDTLPTARELGIGFVAYAPLGRGFLTGRFRAPADVATDSRAAFPRFQDHNFSTNLALVDRLVQLARLRSLTAAQLALAWVMGRGRDVVPIPGSRRRAHLEENVAAAAITLSPVDVAAIEAAFPKAAAAGERYPAIPGARPQVEPGRPRRSM
jgi:aryl-alcohol dehydrogenase-like predicted oxidoreductase